MRSNSVRLSNGWNLVQCPTVVTWALLLRHYLYRICAREAAAVVPHRWKRNNWTTLVITE